MLDAQSTTAAYHFGSNELIFRRNGCIGCDMDLSSALDWLYSTQLFGIKLGLEGTEKLLCAVDAFPSRNVKLAHVAGTNGKGSTCAMIESIAREGGYRTLPGNCQYGSQGAQ